MASSFPSSFAGLLTVLPPRKIHGLCNSHSSLHIRLRFHGILLSLLSDARDGPKLDQGRKGFFEAWKYLKRKRCCSGGTTGRRVGSRLPLTQRLIAARPRVNLRRCQQLTRVQALLLAAESSDPVAGTIKPASRRAIQKCSKRTIPVSLNCWE